MVIVIKGTMSRQCIKALLAQLRSASRKRPRKVDVYKYVGVLSVKEDPATLQRKWRGEWE
jgi:hypothetical protein